MSFKELSCEIQKLQFAAIELNLYLDNFPNNKQAKENYQQVSAKLNELVIEYEKQYGPLKNFGAAYVQNPEKWVNQPWPWELCK
ncbi:MAG: spore coat protein CotJB [Clostridium butyricum]|nr:spore coat protein CotJB [Clostridium butyricum]